MKGLIIIAGITRGDIEHIANLAMITIEDTQMDTFVEEFSAIVEFASQLNEMDTDGIVPTAHIVPVQNVFREDIVKPSSPREEILANAAMKTEECYKVPAIME